MTRNFNNCNVKFEIFWAILFQVIFVHVIQQKMSFSSNYLKNRVQYGYLTILELIYNMVPILIQEINEFQRNTCQFFVYWESLDLVIRRFERIVKSISKSYSFLLSEIKRISVIFKGQLWKNIGNSTFI